MRIYDDKTMLFRVLGEIDTARSTQYGHSDADSLDQMERDALIALKNLGLDFEEHDNGDCIETRIMLNGRIYTVTEDKDHTGSKISIGIDEMLLDEGVLTVLKNGREQEIHYMVIPVINAHEILVFLEHNNLFKAAVSENGTAKVNAYGHTIEFHGALQNGKYKTDIFVLDDIDKMALSEAPYRPDKESRGHIVLNEDGKEIHIAPLLPYLEYDVPEALIWIREKSKPSRPFLCYADNGSFIVDLKNGSELCLNGGFNDDDDEFVYSVEKRLKVS